MTDHNGQVHHMVLFRWKEGAESAAIARAFDALTALKEQIPGILEIACGTNFSERARGYDAGLYVRFVDRAALDAYGPHPAHQAVIRDCLDPIRAETLALDFRVG